MLTETEYTRYRNRIGSPISDKDWEYFTKQYSKLKVGDFVYVYAEGVDEIVKISFIGKSGFKYVDVEGIESGHRYVWTLIRKATKKEVKNNILKLKKHLTFYEKI